METTPSAAELIEAAVETIRAELLPVLSGRAAFQARVAVNVLETARRELAGAPAADAAELARLRGLLGSIAPTAVAPVGSMPSTATSATSAPTSPGPGPVAGPELPALRRALCGAIRDGRADLATPGLADHLWADVLARVAIDQPAYPSFVREAAHPNRTRA
ncbi:MAG: hypothetical protein RJA99_2443 [Pseudomonadota bacterium]